jgi:peptide subunit release factor 1 (eRF1)
VNNTLTIQCPKCDYTFSNKEDFMKYHAVGETIQCPVCGTELELNKDEQLVEIDLERLDDL